VVRILEGPASASERIALVSLQDTNQVTAERTRRDPGVESVLVDGTKRRKALLY
jgi:hypothetical protein